MEDNLHIIDTVRMFEEYDAEDVANYFMELLGAGVELQAEDDNETLFYLVDTGTLLDRLEYTRYLYITEYEYRERSINFIAKSNGYYGVSLLSPLK